MRAYPAIFLAAITISAALHSVSAAAETRLYDLKTQCANDADVNLFAEDIDRTAGNPAGSEVAAFRVNPGGNLPPKAANAYRQLSNIKKFFQEELDYDSADGRGATIHLIANFDSMDDSGRCSGMNAFMASWRDGGRSRFIMGVLQGPRDSVDDIADDLDILGHEFGHGVFYTNYAGAALNTNEVGGINEGIGDMFGVTIRAWNESGQDLSQTVVRADSFSLGRVFASIFARHFNRSMPGGVLRNNLNPAQHGDADHYDYVSAAQREVHSFSGVVSLGYALLVQGGSHPRISGGPSVHGIGFEKAVKILFYTLKNRIPFNNMPEFAMAMRRSAGRIHGEGSLEWRSTNNAFAAVGLLRAVAPYPPAEPEPQSEEEPETQPEQPAPQPEPESEPPAPASTPEEPQPEQPTPAPVEPEAEPVEPGLQVSGPVVIAILGGFILALIMFGTTLKNRRRQELARSKSEAPQVREGGAGAHAAAPEPAYRPAPGPAPGVDYRPAVQPEKRKTKKLVSLESPSTDSRSATLSVAGVNLEVELDQDPIVIGRAPDIGLPGDLAGVLASDGTISRRHMEVWYVAGSNQLYVRCLSASGLRINNHALAKGQKAKVDFDGGAELTIGGTSLHIRPA